MSTGIATLSMYDWPETTNALDVFWQQIRVQLLNRDIAAPVELHHVERQMPLWTDPTLVIGQTCGWPYVNKLRDKVIPFARFDYGLEDCPPGMYQSIYVGQSDEDARFIENAASLATVQSVAINGNDSQSGFHVFAEISGKPSSQTISEDVRVISGGHRNSVKAVAEGKAQIAAIDAVAFELVKRYEPEVAAGVKVIGKSQPKPGLPLITSPMHASQSGELLEAVSRALDGLDVETRDILMIKDVLVAKDEEYEVFARG